MKPLLILLVVFTVVFYGMKIAALKTNIAFAARIAMSVMLLFTAWAHVAFLKGMMLMLPEWIPFKREWILFTGVLEILFAIGISFSISRRLTAWALIVFLILVLPANIKAAMISLDFQRASYSGWGLCYLWFRIPLQFFYIAWVYLCCFQIDSFDKKGYPSK
ncbi:hypothetical protein [Flavobacterium sp. NKUCC04_CG]|uniref:DoxX family protein n=1 Tax=Flavobacterium sp. NKUCC04_CG TaxID=2842121 RepID=UPI001C5B6BFC|nr:hypothetical protein [Flavobacterium sp. NKUCC04_CG]MBW3520447.1 hypothetical protein [Flavobacterium sp. NKUCC04_CG]